MRVLIYSPRFTKTIGGSEFLALTLVAHLQRKHQVSIAVEELPDWNQVKLQYGVDFDIGALETIYIGPRNWFQRVLHRYLGGFVSRELRKLGPDFDRCISCVNMVDFGRPGIHFIYMMNFYLPFECYMQQRPIPKSAAWRKPFRFALDVVSRCIYGTSRDPVHIMKDRRELVLPNSEYVKCAIENYFKVQIGPVFYPPTTYVASAPVEGERSEFGILSIGRIAPGKDIGKMVRIVELARAKSGLDISLHLAGTLDNSEYCKWLEHESKVKSWLVLEGSVYGDEKVKLLSRHQFALHARRDEEFGISITEYLKSGVIPIVPNVGGASEVVGDKDLEYDAEEEAAKILIRLIEDKAYRSKKLQYCKQRALRFSRESYLARQSELLAEIVG